MPAKPLLALALLASFLLGASHGVSAEQRISRAELLDKIRGGWAGQMIGVSYGAPTEFKYQGKINGDPITWSPDMVSNALEQDDLYVEMSFVDVLEHEGLAATTKQFGEAFRQTKFGLCHGNAGARRLLDAGYSAPQSGDPNLNIHANDIDFQIESDFIGLMAPGLPHESQMYATRIGRVMSYGDGLYGGIFVSTMYAIAYFESNPRRIVEQALLSLPAKSGYAQIIRDVLTWSKQYPDDWRRTWRQVESKWDRAGSCTDEAFSHFNISARLNGAYVVIGLIYGSGDFAKTIEIAARSGQDSDCNPSTAGGIVGLILGYNRIPESWKAGLPGIADKRFLYTNYSFNEIAASTMDRALKLVKSSGGKVDEMGIVVADQRPEAAHLEQWGMGVPQRLIEAKNPAWKWTGGWKQESAPGECGPSFAGASTRLPGEAVTLEFTGESISVIGLRSQDGGKADLFLDDKKLADIDFYIRGQTSDNDLWHSNRLAPGQHILRIVTRSDRNSQSTGTRARVGRAIIYKRAGQSAVARM